MDKTVDKHVALGSMVRAPQAVKGYKAVLTTKTVIDHDSCRFLEQAMGNCNSCGVKCITRTDCMHTLCWSCFDVTQKNPFEAICPLCEKLTAKPAFPYLIYRDRVVEEEDVFKAPSGAVFKMRDVVDLADDMEDDTTPVFEL